jgi:hypothetical protein
MWIISLIIQTLHGTKHSRADFDKQVAKEWPPVRRA